MKPVFGNSSAMLRATLLVGSISVGERGFESLLASLYLRVGMKLFIKALNIGGYVLFAMAFFKVIQIRAMNSHLTETQLLINEWDAWLSVLAMCIAGFAAVTAKAT